MKRKGAKNKVRDKVEPTSTPNRICTPSDPHAPPVQSLKQRYPQPMSYQSTQLPDAPRPVDCPPQPVKGSVSLRNTQLFNSVMQVLSQTHCPTSQRTNDQFLYFERLECGSTDDDQHEEPSDSSGNFCNGFPKNFVSFDE